MFRLNSGRVACFVFAATFLVFSSAPAPTEAQQGAEASRKALTVERIFGQPSLSGRLTEGLEWSPDGKWLSYFHRGSEDREGPSELWVMDARTGERRALVSAEQLKALSPAAAEPPAAGQRTGLGRVRPQQYFWAPDASALLFVLHGQLYWFDLKAQAGKALTTGKDAVEDPKISPDGRWASFVRNFNLWVVEVATGRETQLTEGGREELLDAKLDWVYPEELDLLTAYWWSPDSSAIAYLQMDERRVTRYPLVNFLSYTGETDLMRYPKAGDANPGVRVGVVPVGGGPTRWMDTGGDPEVYLARVAWLRDSKRLAIERLNRAQTKLELLFADASTGRAQVILTEEDKYWINVHDAPHFFADGLRFLWSSERDGFRHLYLYDVDGKLLKQLTRGPWVVTDLAGVDEKQGLVYFVATEKSPIERHLYRVSLEGGSPSRLTREEGTHGIRLAPDAAHYVDTYSNAMTPPREDLYRAEGTRTFVINENHVAELKNYGLSPVEFLSVRSASTGGSGESVTLHAMMIKPPDFDASRRYPVLVFIYGGPGAQMVRSNWGGGNFLWQEMMAQKGYIIFTVDNRGSANRGHAFETPIYHHMSEVELADQLAGVNYLRSLPYVDASRIGIWGGSYGGYMTLNAMFRAPDVFKVGIALAPVTDWRQYDSIYTERYMGRPQENPEGYKRSSPVDAAAGLKGKLLIAHGTGDDNVHFANSVELAEQLILARRYAEWQIYPGRGHGISDPPARIHLFNRMTQFLLDNL